MPDTIEWLLSADGCPYCGAPDGGAAARCPRCGRALVVDTSGGGAAAIAAIGGAWSLASATGALMALGAWMQIEGMLPTPRQEEPHQLLKSIAFLLKIRSLTDPVAAPPPPGWFIPLMLITCAAAAAMAWGTLARQRWALGLGLGLSLLLTPLGLVGSLYLRGLPALLPLIIGVALSAALALAHLYAMSQASGRARISSEPAATSAAGLYQEGRAAQQRGMIYLAARHWARASARDPSSATYLHALALALAQLGMPERALPLIEHALQLAPGDQSLRNTAELLRSPPQRR